MAGVSGDIREIQRVFNGASGGLYQGFSGLKEFQGIYGTFHDFSCGIQRIASE